VLQQVEDLPEAHYRDISRAALTWATRFDWTRIARETIEVYEQATLR
jgi:glycosyltransferase involved in cell wall biosynthesis